MAAHPLSASKKLSRESRSQIRLDSTNVIVFTTYTVIYPCSKIIKKEQIYIYIYKATRRIEANTPYRRCFAWTLKSPSVPLLPDVRNLSSCGWGIPRFFWASDDSQASWASSRALYLGAIISSSRRQISLYGTPAWVSLSSSASTSCFLRIASEGLSYECWSTGASSTALTPVVVSAFPLRALFASDLAARHDSM